MEAGFQPAFNLLNAGNARIHQLIANHCPLITAKVWNASPRAV